ncbi:MAG: hypothetical protein DMF56_19360 [Acidobacteria bacterium]|nr:MAG: hypothetical protein DMF56_19360 [Acidobacteriota bacterium]
MLLSACVTTAPSSKANTPPRPNNIKEWMALQSRAKKKALIGALIGAVAGGLSAGIAGGNTDDILKNALAGAVVGAIAGFAIGKREDTIFAGRDLAIRQAGYDRSQGYIARVEAVTFDPPQPKPGETATLYVRYLVLGPDPNETIKVKMFRGLKYGDDYVFGAGPNEFKVPQGGGVVESKLDLVLPKKAPEGTYAAEALLEDSQGRFPQTLGKGVLYILARAGSRGVKTAA